MVKVQYALSKSKGQSGELGSTYWWIWMPLQRAKISIGTYTRSGSTMINTPWHAKIDAQELFYFMILPVGWTLIDLVVSMNFTQMPMELWHVRWMLSQEPWENPLCGGGAPLVTTWNYRCYCFTEKWSWKTRLNGSFQHSRKTWNSPTSSSAKTPV